VLSNSSPPRDAASGAGSGTAAAAADNRPGRRLIAVLLLAAAALDLTRCSLAMTAARHPASAAGLVAAGLAAAALTVGTARGCQAGQRWAGWAALLIGAASAPQAAASGFHTPYTIPDTATAVLGVLLAVAVLATAGRTGRPGHDTENPSPRRGSRTRKATWSALFQPKENQPRGNLASSPMRRKLWSRQPGPARHLHHRRPPRGAAR
jgi:hypothetical protein